MNRFPGVASLLCALFAFTALASSPSSLVTATIPDPGAMAGDNINLIVELHNGYDEDVDLTFDNTSAPPREEGPLLRVWPATLRLPASSHATIEVFGQARSAGRFAPIVRAKVVGSDGVEKYPLQIPVPLVVEDDRAGTLIAHLTDFDVLFGQDREYIHGIGETFPLQFGVGGLIDPTEEPEPVFLPEEPVEGEEARPSSPETHLTITTIKGQYRWKDVNGKIQPATGWLAVVYRYQQGIWLETQDRGLVKSDATFTIPTTVPEGATVRVVIMPSNRYFTLRNKSNQRYQFTFPTFKIGKHGSTYDYGAWWIDLNFVMPGLGELHRHAYDLYSKLMEAGFNPLRSKSIPIVFPNSDSCGSCSTNGAIHIKWDAGTSPHTVKHELGHELMYEYWGAMPKDSGGYHEWEKCYSTGLALSEGFAHFVAWWANVKWDVSSGNWGMGHNGESIGADVCKKIGQNELRVAATFWDLYDIKVDGVDLYTNGDKKRIFEMILGGDYVPNAYINLMYPRLENTGGLEWWRIAPISEQNFTK